MSGEPRCLWCNRAGHLVELHGRGSSPGGGRLLAHPEHVATLEHFLDTADASARRMLGMLALVLVVAIIALPFATAAGAAPRNAVAALAILAVGGLALRHPLAPPPAVRTLGARTARRIARGVGVATILIGALLLAAAFGA